jgi:hypothetical protein
MGRSLSVIAYTLNIHKVIQYQRNNDADHNNEEVFGIFLGVVKAYPHLCSLDYAHFFPPVALQSLKDLGRLTYRRFLELY